MWNKSLECWHSLAACLPPADPAAYSRVDIARYAIVPGLLKVGHILGGGILNLDWKLFTYRKLIGWSYSVIWRLYGEDSSGYVEYDTVTS